MPANDACASVANSVIRAFGRLTDAARALGLPTSTVKSWDTKGRIPYWRRAAIVEAAERLGVTLPDEFLALERQHRSDKTSNPAA
jgi:hypothetical protein